MATTFQLATQVSQTPDDTMSTPTLTKIPAPAQSRSSTSLLRKWSRSGKTTPSPPAATELPPRVLLPETTSGRLCASAISSSSAADEKTALSSTQTQRGEEKEKTVLYLAYGSNLAASTFLITRGIKPLSATNVLVPSLRLTFDLPGIPYKEPCFANTARRDPKAPIDDDPTWQHGLVGVVYEVTQPDYAHIIATEGGGGGYTVVTVECHKLLKQLPPKTSSTTPLGSPETGTDSLAANTVDSALPLDPTQPAFLAHTLLAPPTNRTLPSRDRAAQPSPRYAGLLTTGAAEHDLPEIYQDYLLSLPTYRITSLRQQIGQVIIMATFYPALLALFALGKLVADKQGRYPPWLIVLQTRLFAAIWIVYAPLKVVCGDGERTEGSEAVSGRRAGVAAEVDGVEIGEVEEARREEEGEFVQ